MYPPLIKQLLRKTAMINLPLGLTNEEQLQQQLCIKQSDVNIRLNTMLISNIPYTPPYVHTATKEIQRPAIHSSTREL